MVYGITVTHFSKSSLSLCMLGSSQFIHENLFNVVKLLSESGSHDKKHQTNFKVDK